MNKLTALLKNKKFRTFFIVPITILVSALLRTVAMNVFTVPFNFAPGGVTGIAAMIETELGFNSGWTLMILNVPLLIVAWKYIGKSFTIKTGVAIVISSVGMFLLEEFSPDFGYTEPDNEKIFAAVAAGLIGGLSFAMMLKVGGSSGGTDILAIIIQRRFKATNVAWFIFMLDSTVIVVSFFVYGMLLTPVLMSLTELVCYALVNDLISSGIKTALKFEVITKDPEALADELITKLGRGVTCVPAMGMYLHENETLLICVVRKRQMSKFTEILKHYPNTFAYITSTTEVMGYGFSQEEPEHIPRPQHGKKASADESVTSAKESVTSADESGSAGDAASTANDTNIAIVGAGTENAAAATANDTSAAE